MAKNIHPIFDSILSRIEKEKILGQRGLVLWLTGLSGSGKSTLARGLEKKLYKEGILTKLLDGDNLRTGLNAGLGFSEEDRMETIRRISEVSKLMVNAGVITICSFISPTDKIRNLAREIIGPENFIEVYVSTPLQVCEERDVKGLYKRARSGEIKDFTGISSPFDVPVCPDIEIDTSKVGIKESVDQIFAKIIDRITL